MKAATVAVKIASDPTNQGPKVKVDGGPPGGAQFSARVTSNCSLPGEPSADIFNITAASANRPDCNLTNDFAVQLKLTGRFPNLANLRFAASPTNPNVPRDDVLCIVHGMQCRAIKMSRIVFTDRSHHGIAISQAHVEHLWYNGQRVVERDYRVRFDGTLVTGAPVHLVLDPKVRNGPTTFNLLSFVGMVALGFALAAFAFFGIRAIARSFRSDRRRR